jgi:7-dehydrocholesterol reductase
LPLSPLLPLCLQFFWWETGYFSTLDIMHDRAGYYICWGCLVWVPSVYVSSAYFLARASLRAGEALLEPPSVPLPLLWAALVIGFLAVLANYDADRQRAEVRAHYPAVQVWGRAPLVIHAKYTTDSGEARTSILLASGWWGMARHVHYLPELLAALCWSLPAAVGSSGAGLQLSIMPFFYLLFLTVLLVDRAHRDDARCSHKYGRGYEEYKKLVPWLIVPGIY